MGKAKRIRKQKAKEAERKQRAERERKGKRWAYGLGVLALVFLAALVARNLRSEGDAPAPPAAEESFRVSAKGGALKNLLLITLDTTRADHLGFYGDAGAKTPALDALADKGVVFDAAYAPVPITLPSHSSIMTGCYPPFHGVHNNGSYKLPPRMTTLAEVFGEHGWRTGAFVSAFVLDSRFGLDQGFEVYDDDLWGGKAEGDVLEIRSRLAGQTSERALAWMDGIKAKEGEKFFAWVHFFDAHMPYTPPGPFREDFAASPYDGEIAYMDYVLGGMFRHLDETGVLKDTLVLVTADHGESLDEHGEETHGFFLYNPTVRVPLLFFHPASFPKGLRVPENTDLVDLAPTVLSMFELSAPKDMQGRDLTGALAGRSLPEKPLYMETRIPEEGYGWAPLHGLLEGPWKYIRAPRAELYNLKDDPDEAHNLWGDEKKTGERLSRSFEAFVKNISSAAESSGASKRAMSEAEIEKLKSLGYVFGESGRAGKAAPDPKDMVPVFRTISRVESEHAHNRFMGTEKDLLGILKRFPDDLKARCLLGRTYEETGRPEDGRRAYERVLKRDPHYVSALLGMGYHWMQKKDYARALEFYKQAIHYRKDQNVGAYLQLAACYENTGERPKAFEVLEQALEVSPYASRVYNNLGTLYMKTNRAEDAEENFKKALSLNPNDLMAKKNLNLLYVQTGRTPLGTNAF